MANEQPKEIPKPNNKGTPVYNSLDKIWLKENIEEYDRKTRAMLDTLLNSKCSDDDVAKQYKQLVSFVHNSLSEVRYLMDTRRKNSNFEEKLTHVECSQMRLDKQIRYLTSPCQRWWVMPEELLMELPRTYKTLKPWLGAKDKRTACQFVEEFIEMVLPYCKNTGGAIVEFMMRIYDESSDDVEEFKETTGRKGITFVNYIKKFIETFSNGSVHYKEIIDFDFAFLDNRAVFSSVQFWLAKFRFNPEVHPNWVLDKLIQKLPVRYTSSLLQLKLKDNSNVSYSTISKVIYDQAVKLKDRVPESRDYLGYRVSSNKLDSIRRKYSVHVSFVTDEMDTTNSDDDYHSEDSMDEIINRFI